ncbi:excitatory amino acid transporter 3-like [Leptopilina heterotoma]|uniref:excitatory amino acid transporter 3-like n=1 Tax=Leptopilina heterotoma TaxID=63436 RepID=UPI001CA9A9B5|nr:excitatory amino acid transporter 3-like [Leptopilina heterotoma]
MALPPSWKRRFSKHGLTLFTVIGVFFGVALGLILRKSGKEGWSPREIMYVEFPGHMFLRMLKGLILPLIVSSIISAIGNLDLSLSGKIGKRSIYYYSATTITAVILGIILVLTIRPGDFKHTKCVRTNGELLNSSLTIDEECKFFKSKKLDVSHNVTTVDTILDLIRNIFPTNLVEACIQQDRTELKYPSDKNVSSIYDWDISTGVSTNTNTLGLVIFSIIFGITVAKMGEPGKPLLHFFNALSEAMMVITNWVIWLSPVGVMFLVTAKLIEIDDISQIVGQLGLYFLTVLLGLTIHGFGTLSVIFFVCTRELPFKYLRKMGQVIVTAFGTASSSATLPITLQCLDKMGAEPRITKFVVPIGATINMDGTALYEAVAAIFIAQVRERSLSFGNVIAISITATAASIGAAGIPQAGLVTMVMVLDTVGLPADDVTLILAVDWLLDRFRTTINVVCDALGALIIEKMSKQDLKEMVDNEEDNIELPHIKNSESI